MSSSNETTLVPYLLPSGEPLILFGRPVLKPKPQGPEQLPPNHYWLSQLQFCAKCLQFKKTHDDGTQEIVPISRVHWDHDPEDPAHPPVVYMPMPVDWTVWEVDDSIDLNQSESDADVIIVDIIN